MALGAADYTWAVGIALPSGTECTAYPEGASNDPTRVGGIRAGTDGMARFYPPPGTWGTRIGLDCTLNGSSQGHLAIDLNDSSTFTKLGESDLTPQATGFVRPPLTGDLLAYSIGDLHSHGYSARPDATKSPRRYAQWSKAVTRPVPGYAPVRVTGLGLSGGSTYQGAGSSQVWSGFVQAPAGFSNVRGIMTNTPANGNDLFESYGATISVPIWAQCSGAQCSTLLWVGTGGTPINYSPSFTSSLIQSGLGVLGTNKIQLYWEWICSTFGSGGCPLAGPQFSNAPLQTTPAGGSLGFVDQILVEGWSSSSTGCADDFGQRFACFLFEDVTQNWLFIQGNQFFQTEPNPGGTYVPTSMEYIVEKYLNSPNANYGFSWMEGGGVDLNGNGHVDGSDPYLTVQTPSDSNGQLNFVQWQNGSLNNPANPMFFFFDNP